MAAERERLCSRRRPEEVAGITARIAGGETVLEYDGAGLSLGCWTSPGSPRCPPSPACMEQIETGWMARCAWAGEKGEYLPDLLRDPRGRPAPVPSSCSPSTGPAGAAVRRGERGGVTVLTAGFRNFTTEMNDSNDTGDDRGRPRGPGLRSAWKIWSTTTGPCAPAPRTASFCHGEGQRIRPRGGARGAGAGVEAGVTSCGGLPGGGGGAEEGGHHRPILIWAIPSRNSPPTWWTWADPDRVHPGAGQSPVEAAGAAGKRAKIHIKVDTDDEPPGGAGPRAGERRPGDRRPVRPAHLRPEGIFTTSPTPTGTRDTPCFSSPGFWTCWPSWRKHTAGTFEIRHCARQRRRVKIPCTHLDMVRPGIASTALSDPSCEGLDGRGSNR